MNISVLRLLLLGLIGTTGVSAQQSAVYTHELVDFNKAINLYKNSQYQSAQVLFGKLKSEHPNKEVKAECAYYMTSCAIRLNHSNAEMLMEDFLNAYPENANSNQMFADAATYYFAQGQYAQALKWFEKTDEAAAIQVNRDQFYFEKGYCYFVAKNELSAEKYFNRSLTSKKYGGKSKYYLGYMAYKKDDYTTARKYLEYASIDEEYKDKVDYLLADIYFNLKEFDKAIEVGLKQIDKSKPSEKAEVSKIIGESYFNLEQYEKSIPYLEGYSAKFHKWSNTDYYQLGYAYYKTKNYEKAISQFNQIIEEKNAVTQNAYYHLGESYLKLDKKQEAFNAFKTASEMEFEPKIQEDAFYNYVKISYEIGNPYVSIPEVIQSFLTKYPKTPHKKELESLLISSYVASKNYKEAIKLLEKDKSPANAKIYQKVTFLYGMEQFTNAKYKESLELYKKSIVSSAGTIYGVRALFWKAETEFLQDQFSESLNSYKQFLGLSETKNTTEYNTVHYNIAYVYFKTKDYPQAITSFQKYIDTKPTDKIRLNDAYLRMADSYYVTLKYWPALESYNKAIELNGAEADYAFYQKALCYGYVDRKDKKVEDLIQFQTKHPKSKYMDDAVFELANTYSILNKNQEALATYDKLIAENPKSIHVSKSMLRQALIYFNQEKNSEALVKIKKVVADFPGTPESLEAVSTAKVIYLDTNQVDEYAKWVKTLDFVNVSEKELDNLTYETAERQYLQSNTKQTIVSFENYIAKFPKGIHSLQAHFYLAQAYYADGQEKASAPNYQYVIEKPVCEYTEQSLVRLSEIYLKNKEYAKAIPVLLRLEKEASQAQHITYAESNLMKSYFEEKNFAESVTYAEKVLSREKGSAEAQKEGQIIIARSAIKTGDEAKAQVAYAKMSGAKGELGAEVLYYEAYFKNKEGKYEESNKVVQKLAKDFSGYKYYGAKGLVVMADNFHKLNDAFQATYVLETVIKNFGSYPDVVSEAQTALSKIKEESAVQPNSK